jgi:hypothetical protein
MIVSLNGVIQKPGSSFTISGSTITFASNLVTNDVIDFIQILGDVLDLGVPSDATVTTAKLADDAVTAAKITDSTITAAKLASGTVQNQSAFKNIIINGDMSIAQRTTSAVTINSGTIQYGIDRFGARGMSSAGVFTIEQSTDAPTNFINSFKATVTTADSSIASNSTYRVAQHIEGNMIRNLNWGTAQAQDVTLSFKVKSSLTGTFGGAIINGDYNRFYNFSYTISSANTWTDVSVTIDGDTSGTWVTNNTLGIRLSLSLGAGSGEVGSAGSWGTATYEGVTGQTNLIATNGATWQITGVQLEAGTSASDFEFLPHDVNLTRCQRYFDKQGGGGVTYGTTKGGYFVKHSTTMRATPTTTCPVLTNIAGIFGVGDYTPSSFSTNSGTENNKITHVILSGLPSSTVGIFSSLKRDTLFLDAEL